MSDFISRQAAIDAINEREWLTQDAKEILAEVIEQLPSAQLKPKISDSGSVDSEMPEIETDRTMSGDLISRAAAIRWVKAECNPYGKPTLEFESGKKVIEHLKQMPSAQPDTLSYLTDRPCDVCKCHTDDGCSKWECVFERRTMDELKPCPYRIHGERTKSLTVEGEYYYNETFMPCMQNACPCFHVSCMDAYCDRNGGYMSLGRVEHAADLC